MVYGILMGICFLHSYMFGKWVAMQGLSRSNTWLLWAAIFTAEMLFFMCGVQIGRGAV